MLPRCGQGVHSRTTLQMLHRQCMRHCMRSHVRILAPSIPVRQSKTVGRAVMEQIGRRTPVLLFDVMDTIVYDPFFKEMPKFFQMSFQDLLKEKHPTAWVDFECGHIDEAQLCKIFFNDSRPVDRAGLIEMLRANYRFLEGMEPLLARLSQAGYEMHALSNYPVWYEIIEDKLRLSRFMDWTFVSCTGPMQGVRKPNPEAYRRVIDHLGVPPGELLFVDDRTVNIQAAEAEGVPSLIFTNSEGLEQELKARGLVF